MNNVNNVNNALKSRTYDVNNVKPRPNNPNMFKIKDLHGTRFTWLLCTNMVREVGMVWT
jgi:hypothetical protein